MERDRFELAEQERPVAAHRVVLRDDPFQRSRHVGREDHVNHVLAVRARRRRDRVDDRHRAFEGHLDTLGEESRLLL